MKRIFAFKVFAPYIIYIILPEHILWYAWSKTMAKHRPYGKKPRFPIPTMIQTSFDWKTLQGSLQLVQVDASWTTEIKEGAESLGVGSCCWSAAVPDLLHHQPDVVRQTAAVLSTSFVWKMLEVPFILDPLKIHGKVEENCEDIWIMNE